MRVPETRRVRKDCGPVTEAGRAAMDLAEEHRRHIDRWFYPCSHGMHRNLAETYTADPRFEAYFEKRGKGLAMFVQDAIRTNEARWRNRIAEGA